MKLAKVWRRVGLLVLTLANLVGCRRDDSVPASRPALPPVAEQRRERQASAPAQAQVYPSWSALAGKKVVLITHPQPHVLRGVRTLLERQLLAAPDLYVLGLYHAGERESYAEAGKLVRALATANNGGVQQVGLHRLDCKISADEVFAANGCSASFAELLARSTGIIFTGGPDIPPALYGEATHLTTVIRAPQRHNWEISLLYHLVGGNRGRALEPLLERRPRYAVFAICLGLQSLNVAAGGTLFQDIPAELYGLSSFEDVVKQPAERQHRNPYYFLDPADGVSAFVMHPIRLAPDPFWRRELALKAEAADATQRQVVVPSAHHQAIKRLGRGLVTIATSLDGKVVEAVRHSKYPHVIGVQFHPEYSFVWDPEIEARLYPGQPQHNYFTATLQAQPASAAFHRQLWALLSRWVSSP